MSDKSSERSRSPRVYPLSIPRARELGLQIPLLGAAWGQWLQVQQKLIQSRLIETLGKTTIQGVGGRRFLLNLTAMHDVIQYQEVLRRGLYEPETTILMLERAQTGETFIDIGANNGYFSIMMAGSLGTTGRVLAFEPNLSAAERFVTNLQLNSLQDRVHLFRLALGETGGRVPLYLHPFEDGGGSLLRHIGWRNQMVQVARGDDVISAFSGGIVKMDIEGSELSAIKGMKKILGTARDLVLEWNRAYAKVELWEALQSLFDVYRILPTAEGGYALSRVRTRMDLRMSLTNLLCTRDAP